MRKALFLTLIFALSCSRDYKKLHIVTRRVEMGKLSQPARYDSLSVYQDKYLEISLGANPISRGDPYYEAIKEINSGKVTDPGAISYSYLIISDERGEPLKFFNFKEFVDYMRDHGYKVKTEKPTQDGAAYLFESQ